MSWVVAPWKPRSAKTRAAASMISGARRRAVGRREVGSGTTVMSALVLPLNTPHELPDIRSLALCHGSDLNSTYRAIDKL